MVKFSYSHEAAVHLRDEMASSSLLSKTLRFRMESVGVVVFNGLNLTALCSSAGTHAFYICFPIKKQNKTKPHGSPGSYPLEKGNPGLVCGKWEVFGWYVLKLSYLWTSHAGRSGNSIVLKKENNSKIVKWIFCLLMCPQTGLRQIHSIHHGSLQ